MLDSSPTALDGFLRTHLVILTTVPKWVPPALPPSHMSESFCPQDAPPKAARSHACCCYSNSSGRIICLDNLHQFPALPEVQPAAIKGCVPRPSLFPSATSSMTARMRARRGRGTESPAPAPTGEESLSQG